MRKLRVLWSWHLVGMKRSKTCRISQHFPHPMLYFRVLRPVKPGWWDSPTSSHRRRFKKTNLALKGTIRPYSSDVKTPSGSWLFNDLLIECVAQKSDKSRVWNLLPGIRLWCSLQIILSSVIPRSQSCNFQSCANAEPHSGIGRSPGRWCTAKRDMCHMCDICRQHGWHRGYRRHGGGMGPKMRLGQWCWQSLKSWRVAFAVCTLCGSHFHAGPLS